MQYVLLQVLLSDKYTMALKLKTLNANGWLQLSWHPVVGRVSLTGPPGRGNAAEMFSFGEQVGGNRLPQMHPSLISLDD